MEFSIMVVDDEDNFREGIRQNLVKKGYEIYDAENLKKAREILSQHSIDIILLDVQIKKEYGPDLLYDISRMRPTPRTIIITAYGEVEMAVDAMKNGAFDFLSKPINFSVLEARLKKAEDMIQLQRELDNLKGTYLKSLSFVKGQNLKMNRLFQDAERSARAQASVLINGETGVGKEIIAKYIHQIGPRSSKPFIPLCCPAIQPTVLESELFGYEQGAFTGADKKKQGLFEAADGGILFLDEISSMGPDMQAKILRAIEDKKIRHVGGLKEISVDVQIIAASNKDLPKMIENQEFRSDLYYRLRVVDLTVPPLHERMDDLPEFVGFFVKAISQQRGLNITGVSTQVLNAFQAYSWPGNIRELHNVIERSSIFCEGDTIQISDIPTDIANLI
ncbi:MAG: sigma-54-dependent transcriptional regulator [Flexilinea sp.]